MPPSEKPGHEAPDFSLVAGGPLYQMLRRAHLAGPALEHMQYRILFFIGIAWLPLFLLSWVDGRLQGGQGLPFLRDIDANVRFLVALPILILAERIVHLRIGSLVRLFLDRGIISAKDISKFDEILGRAMKLRNSIFLELILLVFVLTIGHWVWRNTMASSAASWFAVSEGTTLHLTLPGYWYGFVSIPIIQFILLRWYMRLMIWFWLLWRVSRLNLQLIPAHPDRAGGIGFLGQSSEAFGIILFAQGALLAGVIAGRIFYEGQTLASFKVTIAGLIGLFVVGILGPLMMFTSHLIRARWRGLIEYGTLSTEYVTDFDNKWLRRAKTEDILGTSDIQALADLSSSYRVVSEMRVVPFTLKNVVLVVLVTAIPLAPLLPTLMPLDELLARLVKIVFAG